ncbi:MAG: class I SAM-dependent methyltransferase, partial [Merismopedia sp. SIO2A8]|nr:class I SAM-dependent methyltransferase [Merismopedia sp. SIO2A8]
VGFGGGDLVARLLDTKMELQIAGIDPSPTSIAMVKKRFRQPIILGQITLHQSSADAIPFTDNMFDAIATVNTLYFWPDAGDVLRECHRVLKPGGKVAIAYNSKEFLDDNYLTQRGFQAYEAQELETSLTNAGFTQVHTVSEHSPQNGPYFCTYGVAKA